MSVTEVSVRRLSVLQREMLIDHIDCIVPIDRRDTRSDHAGVTRNWLIANKFLKCHPTSTYRPTGTSLTEDGRAAVCIILGDYADALVRAGLLELDDESPLEVLRRMRVVRTGMSRGLASHRPAKRGYQGRPPK